MYFTLMWRVRVIHFTLLCGNVSKPQVKHCKTQHFILIYSCGAQRPQTKKRTENEIIADMIQKCFMLRVSRFVGTRVQVGLYQRDAAKIRWVSPAVDSDSAPVPSWAGRMHTKHYIIRTLCI